MGHSMAASENSGVVGAGEVESECVGASGSDTGFVAPPITHHGG